MSTTPKKILVVEDDRVTQAVICQMLNSAGYMVAAARDASTAVKIARELNPDLITLDIVLAAESPDDSMDGFKVATWLKRLNPDMQTPIIIISGMDPKSIARRSVGISIYTSLPKPVEKEKLLAAVAGALK